jgi:hypothetical protein
MSQDFLMAAKAPSWGLKTWSWQDDMGMTLFSLQIPQKGHLQGKKGLCRQD